MSLVPHSSLHLIFTCTTFLSLFISQASTADEKKAVYQELLEYLKNHDVVLPPVPDTYVGNTLFNPEAVVPPQCYTRTEARTNVCYVCHQDHISGRENKMNDRDLQEAYSFSDVGMTNHWKNLFEDRTSRVAAISDEEIQNYVDQDNYSELAGRLKEKGFKGYIPDLKNLHLGAEAFDKEGFAKDGSHWVAFNYKPFPSTFWPTNGSTDDVMIRLAAPFRTDKQENYSPDIYKANLAILEAAIKGVSEISSLPIDETKVGKDLDGDGVLKIAHHIKNQTSWVGDAEGEFFDTHLYPAGTEFLHTVRYVGVGKDGQIGVSTRMKEVRYMWKVKPYVKSMYGRKYQLEANEKEAGNLPGYVSIGQHGLDNGNGWAISGFIEDRKGSLRFLTHEENFSCMGCHNSVGSTIDKTFSFPRKLDGAKGWGYIDLKGMVDAPSKGEQIGEIELYLSRAEGGSEFRNNDEMFERWFKPDGKVDREKIAKAKDVYDLITPSPERAMSLNKAYLTIVQDQDYIFGKDPVIVPPKNVYDKIDNNSSPTLPADRIYDYNIILDWSAKVASEAKASKEEISPEKNESSIPSESNHPMNRFTTQYIAIPAILVAAFIIVITKFNDSENVTPVVKHVSPTKHRARENSTVTAMTSNRIRRDNSATSEDITHNPRNTSEEFWSELLLEVRTNDEFNDRETGSKLITIASNPKAPESIRKEAIADALVFIDDENYEHDIKPLAIRTDLPDTMQNIILDDLLKRPQPTALPLARYIASTNGHVLAEVLDEYVKSYE